MRRKLPRSSRKMMRRRRKQTLQTLDLSVETRKQISGFVQLALAAVTFLVIQGKAGIMGEGVFNVLTFFFGQASMQLKIVWQRHRPCLVSSTFKRSAQPLSRVSKV